MKGARSRWQLTPTKKASNILKRQAPDKDIVEAVVDKAVDSLADNFAYSKNL